MGEVQPFTEEHARGVASLYWKAMRGQSRPPGPNLSRYFCEILLSSPWASSDIPSLVYLENGKVTGSLGVVPRTMEFRGRPIRVATMTQFMVDPEHRRGPAAVELLRHNFRGPQDMSWTDGAADEVSRLWAALGGYTAPLYAFNWIRILRPLGTVRSGLDRLGRTGKSLQGGSALLTGPLDFLLSKLPVPIFREPVSTYSAKLATPEELLSRIQEIGWREALKPVYSGPSFAWQISQAAKLPSGRLRTLTVSDRAGDCYGWFVYHAKAGGAGYVLQIGVKRRDCFPEVLRALFRDAWQQKCVWVKGQAIPQYLTSLTRENCFFRHPDASTLVHSRDQDILNVVRLGEAALTRLDGECWLRFSAEDWA